MTRVSSAVLLATLGLALYAQSPYGRPLAVRNVGIDQKLDAPVPLDAAFNDETGNTVKLRQFFSGKKPVLLALVYYRCPMLCNLVLNGQVVAMRQIGLKPGTDYEAVTISFDPEETPEVAAAKKQTYVEKFDGAGAGEGWHFLTGSLKDIRTVADAVGFRYVWDDQTKQWAHGSGLIVLTPDAHVSRYLFGINFPKRDLRLALVDASKRKIGNLTDQILLLCYHYDPKQGKYSLAILNTLRVSGTTSALLLAAFVVFSLRRERRGRA